MYFAMPSRMGEIVSDEHSCFEAYFSGTIYQIMQGDLLLFSDDEPLRGLDPLKNYIRVLRINNRKNGLVDVTIPCRGRNSRLWIPESDLVHIE